ncbi:hypothetical protein COCON_G00040700 [Conger conger]|uniref:Ig-like domain-containing protein n=1 Tax=Conger conger TaxID=82655 RepID=A0A9Q1I4J2_CONCO|nr:hypothetical protein COCON_G00040700 [Conger conger]
MNTLCSSILLTQLLLHLLPVCDGSTQTLIGQTGGSVTLPCLYDVKANGLTPICWGRDLVPTFKCSNTIVSTDGEQVTIKESRRYRLQSGLKKGNVSLTIVNLTEEDSGIYGCRVEIPGLFNDKKLNFDLTVVKGVWGLPAETENLDDKDVMEDATHLPTIKMDSSTSTDDLPSNEVEKISHKFNGNIIRLGLVIFIPGLIVLVILDLRSLQQKNRRRSAQSDDSAPAVQVRN